MKYNSISTRRVWRAGVAVGVGALMIGALSACSGGSTTSADSGTQADIDAALQKDTTLTMWAWSDGMKAQADAFTKKYPHITFNFVKVDNPDAAVTKLQNAVKAGSGAPDLVPVEYQTLPQLTLGGALADMSKFGLNTMYQGKFTPSTWNAVNVQNKLVGIPMDSGPMVLIYNKDMFAKAGITSAPKTWDDYAAASAAIHKADPSAYIATGGDAGFITSMIWATGGQPFKTDGKNVTINLQDAGTKKFADYWNTLNQKGELSPLATWSDEWTKALTQDKLATVMMGSWMIGGGMDGYGPAGRFVVAPMPTWDGTPGSAENGGSAISVTEQSKNKAAAAGFLEFIADGAGRAIINQTAFPSTMKELANPAFLDKQFPGFGGQEANKIGAASAASVIKGWQYLPYQGYANNVFPDSVGKALGAKTDLNAALQQWQQTLVDYGKQQGFSVNQ